MKKHALEKQLVFAAAFIFRIMRAVVLGGKV